jgi:hypothetical protein
MSSTIAGRYKALICDQKLASDGSGLSGGFRGIGCGFTKWKMGARQLLFWAGC